MTDDTFRSTWFGSRAGAGRAVRLVIFAGLGLSGCNRAEPIVPRTGPDLKVETGKQAKLDPDAALRCFVHGQFVGMQTPAECAQKNGVATGALDVGLDQSGALAEGGGTPLQSIANAQAESDIGAGGAADPAAKPETDSNGASSARSADAERGDCLRFGRNGWRGAGQALSLNACVHLLFDDRCVAAGQEIYGRWGTQTLRLAPGRVEISSDDKSFRPLVREDSDDCTIPDL